MMCGMRNLPMMIGANRMMSNTTKKINVGLVMGKYDAMLSIDLLYSYKILAQR